MWAVELLTWRRFLVKMQGARTRGITCDSEKLGLRFRTIQRQILQHLRLHLALVQLLDKKNVGVLGFLPNLAFFVGSSLGGWRWRNQCHFRSRGKTQLRVDTCTRNTLFCAFRLRAFVSRQQDIFDAQTSVSIVHIAFRQDTSWLQPVHCHHSTVRCHTSLPRVPTGSPWHFMVSLTAICSSGGGCIGHACNGSACGGGRNKSDGHFLQ